jgi:transcriptional regulator with XRE-family HTH domain
MTMPVEASTAATSFGALLREWRRTRGASQLELALLCGLSQKHLSFLESGRSRPSRGMVLNLACALDVPLAQQNAMLLAAGFAPLYRTRSLDAPEMRPIEQAFACVLAQQEPFPALVLDRGYELVRVNRGMQTLLAFLTDGAGIPADGTVNTAELVMRPDRLRPFLENWEEIAVWLLRQLRAETLMQGAQGRSHAALLARLRALPGVSELERTVRAEQDLPPTLVARFVKAGTRLALFSVNASLGTPLDVSLQSLHLELFFPADDATRQWFEARASG